MNENVIDFHSGKRLALARKLLGLTQEELVADNYFPDVDVRTLRRWECRGINLIRVSEVAQYFRLEQIYFLDDQLSQPDFIRLVC